MRATDIKNNPRITLPKHRSAKEEVELGAKGEVVFREASNYMSSLQEQPENLTKSERRGLRKLLKRIKAGELVVLETDKSNKLCVMPMEMYKRMGIPHTQGDPEASWEEVIKAKD